MTQDEIAIRALVEEWMRASAQGDVDTVLRLMTDDVVFMVPGREPFGKTEFAENARALAGARLDGKSEIVELKIAGDVAYLRNRLEVSITPQNGETVRRKGYTLTLLHKEADGKWRLTRDANLLAPVD